MSRQPDPDREWEQMMVVQTLTSPGWEILSRRLDELVSERMKQLRYGGVVQHDRNVGMIEGVELVRAKFGLWLSEARMIGEPTT